MLPFQFFFDEFLPESFERILLSSVGSFFEPMPQSHILMIVALSGMITMMKLMQYIDDQRW